MYHKVSSNGSNPSKKLRQSVYEIVDMFLDHIDFQKEQ